MHRLISRLIILGQKMIKNQLFKNNKWYNGNDRNFKSSQLVFFFMRTYDIYSMALPRLITPYLYVKFPCSSHSFVFNIVSKIENLLLYLTLSRTLSLTFSIWIRNYYRTHITVWILIIEYILCTHCDFDVNHQCIGFKFEVEINYSGILCHTIIN